MKKKTQRLVVIVLIIAMALTIIVPAITVLVGAQDIDDLKNEISETKDKISENDAQIAEVEKKLKAIRAEKADAMEEKELLEEKIYLIEEQIEATQAVIENYDALILEKEGEIADLEAKEAAQYDLFCRQVRDMEETGSASYLSILFSARSFSELLDYAMLIGEVMEYHNGVIDALLATRAELAGAKAELESARAEQEVLKGEQEARQAELEVQMAEVDRLIKKIKETEDEYEEELEIFEKAAKELDKELANAEKKYEEELAALAADNGNWYWPLPGLYYISSSFAPRKHPITGKWSHHTGNDIPAAGGTKIHAAKAGIVTDVGKDSVYGNYIQISHGNGQSTFYAHMRSKAIVKEGEKVTKGQVIGYVGTTGWSTGNHLHFELRVNGVREDALELYPNLEFTYKY